MNKAPGSDNIPGIVFKSFTDQMTSFTIKLFNNILIQENYPGTGIIKPLYKKGDPKDPKNYRGITLLLIIGKLFTQILTNRIALWAEKHILIEAQYGLRKGRRTTDPTFILSQVISYERLKGKPLLPALWT